MSTDAAKRLSAQLDKANQAANAGRRAEAQLIYDEVSPLAGDDALLHIELGHLCSNLDQIDAAIEHYAIAVRGHSENAQYLRFLGVAHQQNGQPDEAFPILNRALEIDPEIHSVLHALGLIYASRSDDSAAREHLEKAERLKPDDAGIQSNLAMVLTRLNEHELALKHAENAVTLSPADPVVHYSLAIILSELGRTDEAIRRFKKAIERKRTFGAAYDFIARMQTFSAADLAFINQTESVLKDDMPARDRSSIHYALGKMYDDCRTWDKAFEHYRQANLLQKKPFDSTHEKKQLEKMKKLYSAVELEEYRGLGHPSRVPVFIVGMPRSGTTLMERIIASHPQAAGAGELPVFPRVSSVLAPSHDLGAYIDTARKNLTKENVNQLANEYLQILKQGRESAERVVDKLPGNFFHLGLIATMFPNATIIHATRHPLDTGLSCYFQNFGDVPWANDLGTIGEIQAFTNEVMDYWKSVLPEGAIAEVNYEELVADPAKYGQRMIEACGLTWDDKSLEFHSEEGVVKTASFWQVRQPIYQTSRMRWMNYASQLGVLADALPGSPREERAVWREHGVPIAAKSGLGLIKKLFSPS